MLLSVLKVEEVSLDFILTREDVVTMPFRFFHPVSGGLKRKVIKSSFLPLSHFAHDFVVNLQIA